MKRLTDRQMVRAILDGLAMETGDQTSVAYGEYYYLEAEKRFVRLLRAERRRKVNGG